jgi:hypothetical protein
MQTKVKDGGLGAIDAATRGYADALARLEAAMAELEAEARTLKRRHLARIKRAAELAANAKGKLHGELEARPELFVRPRTLVLHGVKVGWQKSPDTVEVSGRTPELIRLHMPERASALLKVTETPIKDALRELDAGELKRVAARVVEGEDAVVIKPAGGEVEKLVDALLREEAA